MKRKTVTLRVHTRDTIEVLAPAGLTRARMDALLNARLPWIERATRTAPDPGPPHRFLPGERFPLLGEGLTLMLVVGEVRPRVQVEGDRLWVRLGRKQDGAEIRRLIEGWYRREARRIFAERVALYAPRMRVTPAAITIRNPRFRWGSCSSNGTLNFCWRAVMAPLWVVDYLTVHELGHLRIRGHGVDFWRLVESYAPRGRSGQLWLRDHGATLHF